MNYYLTKATLLTKAIVFQCILLSVTSTKIIYELN